MLSAFYCILFSVSIQSPLQGNFETRQTSILVVITSQLARNGRCTTVGTTCMTPEILTGLFVGAAFTIIVLVALSCTNDISQTRRLKIWAGLMRREFLLSVRRRSVPPTNVTNTQPKFRLPSAHVDKISSVENAVLNSQAGGYGQSLGSWLWSVISLEVTERDIYKRNRKTVIYSDIVILYIIPKVTK